MEKDWEKAKEEVKEEVRSDIRQREEKSENVVIYGMNESTKEDAPLRKKDDVDRVEEMMKNMEIEINKDEMDQMNMFRSGKKREDEKPRPLIVKVPDAEKRMMILNNGRKLAKKEEWKTVFVAQDMTWQQREDARKQEREMKMEAEAKNGKEKEEKTWGRWIVVGPRGKRRLLRLQEAVEDKKKRMEGGE